MGKKFFGPIEELVTKQIKCSCGRTHRAQVPGILIEHGAVDALPQLLAAYKNKTIFVIGDGNTMVALGDRAVTMLAAEGFTPRKFVFPGRPSPACDHRRLGELLVSVPEDTGVVLAVGSGTICDMAKYLCFKEELPLVELLTAASADSFALPFSTFIDNKRISIERSVAPKAIIADLDVLAKAPKKLTVSGLGSAFAKFVSVFDWYLSNVVTGTYFCPEAASYLLSQVRDLGGAVSCGFSVTSDELVEPLIRCLISSGVLCGMVGTLQLARGAESALADFMYERALNVGGKPDIGILRGFSACTCVHVYDNLTAHRPDFKLGESALEGFGWVDYNREMLRVYGERAEDILSATDGMYFSDDAHFRRVRTLELCWDDIISDLKKLMPPYSQLLPLYQMLSFPYKFAQLGMKKDDAQDTLLYSFLLSDRYNLFSMLWDLGLIDRVTGWMTRDLRVSTRANPQGFTVAPSLV